MLHGATNAANQDGLRVLLYSHDSVGLGHLRRTLTVATAIREAFPGALQVVATGSPCATRFQLPDGAEVVKLPSIGKDERGAYAPRASGFELQHTVALRREILQSIVESLTPDLVIVDQKALGVEGELAAPLRRARALGARTILGVRDIIDEPEAVGREWGRGAVRAALTELYDRVVVYGAPEVFDPRVEYPFPPELAASLEFSGYVVRPPRGPVYRPLPPVRPRVLVTTGGGEDGADRIRRYLDALDLGAVDWDSAVVLGPMLEPHVAEELRRRARARRDVQVIAFEEDLPTRIAEADAVCAMAGYNTSVEILRAGTPVVYLPRTAPRMEQWIRASRLQELGLARCLDRPSPRELREALEGALAGGRVRKPLPSLDGRTRVAAIAGELLRDRSITAPLPSEKAAAAVAQKGASA